MSLDYTTESRILQTALELFPKKEFRATTVRDIAGEAGVSPALVIHHFGSKEGLREACDRYVVNEIRDRKRKSLEEGVDDPESMAANFGVAGPLMRYLGWSLSTGSDHAAEMFREMVTESAQLTQLGIDAGVLSPTDDPKARAAVLLSMQLGSLLLSDHVSEYLGVDVAELEGVMRYSKASLEIFSGAIFAPGQAETITTALDAAIQKTREGGNDG